MINVLSLFSGIGAFEKALENLGVDHEVLAYCEIDKYASKAYSIIHGIPESKNLIDVTKVDILDIAERVDLITYGFPCQDISVAGKRKGFVDEDGNKTRSGLFFEALRIIDDYRPKFAIAENVKALTSKKFSTEFKIVLESLEEIGYNNYWAVLNAKDFNIPQNRERVLIISIRKDIDRGFTFPKPVPLELRLKDLLESEVDEKYYLSDHALRGLITHNERNRSESLIDQIGQIYPNSGNPQAGRIYNADGLSPTLDTCTGGNRMPKIIDDTQGFDGVRTYENYSPTLRSSRSGLKTSDGIRVRKLTPNECYKLMGFTAEDCKKVSEGGISNSQLYKQAGNSIVVNVLEAIFTSFGKYYEEFRSVSR